MKSKETAHVTITKNPRVLVSEVDGEIIMLSVERGKYYSLNHTGSALWKLLDLCPNIEQLKTALLGEYEVDSDACEIAIQRLVGELTAEGLINIE